MEGFIIILIVGVLWGALTNHMGNKKNIPNCFWWGFFLGLIGVIVVAASSQRDRNGKKIKY